MHKILTWRYKAEAPEEPPVDLPPGKKHRPRPRQRELFVKWLDKSYWACEWISELQVCDQNFNFLYGFA